MCYFHIQAAWGLAVQSFFRKPVQSSTYTAQAKHFAPCTPGGAVFY